MTLLTVAKDACVSKSAVSDIINGKNLERYRPETVQRVLNSARSIGYQAHSTASLLRAKRTHLIGVFSSNPTSAYSALMTNALVKAVRARPPYKPLFIDAEVLRSHPVNNSVGFELVEGLFWSLPPRDNEILRALVSRSGTRPHIVTLGHLYPRDLPVSSVVSDIADASRKVTEYLIGQGHTRIAILYRAPHSTNPRYAGYRTALKVHDLPLQDELCLPLPDEFEPDSSFRGGQQLTKRLFSLPKPPTAIVCHNDEVATGALNAAYHMGLSVPGDISIAGFDGTPLSEFTVPPLTTVELPIAAMMEAAVDLMINRLENEAQGKHEVRRFPATYVWVKVAHHHMPNELVPVRGNCRERMQKFFQEKRQMRKESKPMPRTPCAVKDAKGERKGFTLIKLLVVIAIIALLAAILFPAFARARENARRASCQSNMKQIALGVKMYVQDYDEKFPLIWQNQKADGSVNTARTGQWITATMPYIKSAQVLACPSYKPAKSTEPYSYAANGYLFGKNESVLTSSAVIILNWELASEADSTASQAAPLLEVCGAAQVEPYGPLASSIGSKGCFFPGKNGESERHLGGANYSFVDGHVKWYRVEQIKEDTINDPDPTFTVH